MCKTEKERMRECVCFDVSNHIGRSRKERERRERFTEIDREVTGGRETREEKRGKVYFVCPSLFNPFMSAALLSSELFLFPYSRYRRPTRGIGEKGGGERNDVCPFPSLPSPPLTFVRNENGNGRGGGSDVNGRGENRIGALLLLMSSFFSLLSYPPIHLFLCRGRGEKNGRGPTDPSPSPTLPPPATTVSRLPPILFAFALLAMALVERILRREKCVEKERGPKKRKNGEINWKRCGEKGLGAMVLEEKEI